MDIEIIPWEVAAGAEKVEDWQNTVSMATASGVNMSGLRLLSYF